MFIESRSLSPIEFGALRIFDYTARHDLSSSFARIQLPPGAAHPDARSKRSDKYYIVVSGSVRFVVEGESRDLATGDVCIVGRGERFGYSNPTSQEASLVLVHTPSFRLEDEVFVE